MPCVVRRVPRRLVEQRQLAERLAGSDGRDLAALPRDPGGALDDHEELLARLPFGNERFAGRHLHVLRPPGHQLEVLPGAGREQRDLLQVIDEGISARHGPEI